MRKYGRSPPSTPECGYPAPLTRCSVVVRWHGNVRCTYSLGVVYTSGHRGPIVVLVPESESSANFVLDFAFARRVARLVNASTVDVDGPHFFVSMLP